jgi:hypothetical protein
VEINRIIVAATALTFGLALSSSAQAVVQCEVLINDIASGQVQDVQTTSAANAACAAGPDSASANNNTGILRAAVSAPDDVASAADTALGDNITIKGMQGTNTYVIPITMTIDGSYGATSDGDSQFVANLAVGGLQSGGGEIDGFYAPGQGVDRFETTSQGDTATFDVVSSTKSNVLATITAYADVSASSPSFQLLAQLDAGGDGPIFADFSHTATLGIDLPPGLSFTSDSPGFLSGIPEPSTWAMMLIGIGLIGGGLRMARRKTGMALTAA